ncbi:hypothetical protein ACM25O_13315 [Sulfitobacter pontiacus]
MSLRTQYRGYTIHYAENRDSWDCSDCGVSESSLGKAKSKIDSLHLKLRKSSAVDAYEISRNESEREFSVKATEARIIDYGKPRIQRSGYGENRKEYVEERVFSMAVRHGNGKASRSEQPLNGLAPVTPEVHAAIDEANRLGVIAHAAVKEFRAAARAIPRLKLEDITGLIEAARHQFEEGEA